MSGYRMMVGYGQLSRNNGEKIEDLPTDLPIYSATDDCCMKQLTKRFGAGVSMSINRNRNNTYHQDIGLREFTVATSGMYEVDFTIDGAFAPECSDWIEYGMMSEKVVITASSTFAETSTGSGVGYVTNGGVTGTTPILKTDFESAQAKITAGGPSEIHLYSYINMDGPRYFDIAYEQVNENTTYGGLNEMGVITGCTIESFSINYDSGGDATVKFSLNCTGLREFIATTSQEVDYSLLLEDVPSTVLVTGCISQYDEELGEYDPIAQTDSAGITVTNNTTKLGNCMKLNYSSVTLGPLTIDLSTSTYSNNPNKYMTHMYGYDMFVDVGKDVTEVDSEDDIPENPTDCQVMKVTTAFGSYTKGFYVFKKNADEWVKKADMDIMPTEYTIAKQPKAIPKMKIRSDNTSSTLSNATEFLDIDLTDVFVGSANRTYNVDNAIMDEPELRPRKIRLAVGFKR